MFERFRIWGVAAALAFAPVIAGAATVSPTITAVGPDLTYDYGVLPGEANDTDSINLLDARDHKLDFFASPVAGSLTINTYVDPFAAGGYGIADILLSRPLAGGASFTVQWGNGAIVDLSDGAEKAIGVAFSGSGEQNGQDLVFAWAGIENAQQLSVAITAVPVPAAGFLLMGALGGLGFAARRKNKKA